MTELEIVKKMLKRAGIPFSQKELSDPTDEDNPVIFWLYLGTDDNYLCDMYFDTNGKLTEVENMPRGT